MKAHCILHNPHKVKNRKMSVLIIIDKWNYVPPHSFESPYTHQPFHSSFWNLDNIVTRLGTFSTRRIVAREATARAPSIIANILGSWLSFRGYDLGQLLPTKATINMTPIWNCAETKSLFPFQVLVQTDETVMWVVSLSYFRSRWRLLRNRSIYEIHNVQCALNDISFCVIAPQISNAPTTL